MQPSQAGSLFLLTCALLMTSSDSEGLLGAGSAPLRAAYKAAWRDSVFIEYYYNDYNSKCTANCTTVPASQYPHADSSCTELVQSPNGVCWGGEGFGCTGGCYQTETPANNFIAVRNMEGSAMGNTLYAEYESGYVGRKYPLATKNLLEDTDGLRRPPSKGGGAIHQ